MTTHLYRQLKEVSETRGARKRVDLLQQYDSPHLAVILDLAFNPAIQFNVKREDVVWEPSKDSEQSLTPRLKQEAKKLVNLSNIGPYPNLPYGKKLQVLKNILETLHPEDAELLLCVIEKRMPFANITAETIKEAFPYFEEKWKTNEEKSAPST